MTGLWRLTRNRYGRRLYEGLAERGVRVSKLYRYVTSLDQVPSASPPAGIDVTVRTTDEVPVAAFEEPATDDQIVLARRGEATVGHCFLSHDREVHVEALEAWHSFDGAYVWRVFVDPAERQRGVATALLTRALHTASALGADRAVALVAVDNHPSQRLFERLGFEADGTTSYYRLFGLQYRNGLES